MKVLQVVKTNRGATWAFNQAKNLKNLGVEMVTVLPHSNEGYAAKYKEVGMDVIEGDWSLPVTRPWKFFAKRKEIKAVVKKISPDIIHLHFVTNVLMCRLVLRSDRTPRFFQVPGPLHLENKLISFVERHTATKADYWGGVHVKKHVLFTGRRESQKIEYFLHTMVFRRKKWNRQIKENCIKSFLFQKIHLLLQW